MKRLIFMSILTIGFACCNKKNDSHTLSGRIVKDCSGLPLANDTITIYQELAGGLNPSGGKLGKFTTDSNGKFSHTYESANGGYLEFHNGYGTLMSGIPGNRDVDNIFIYAEPKFNFQLSLNVLNPHSIGDTLFIKDIRVNQFLKIPCPLSNGLLYVANDVYLPAMGYDNSAAEVIWNFKINPSSPPQSKNFIIDKYCSDTVKAIVDIN